MTEARRARDTDFFKGTQEPKSRKKKRMARAQRQASKEFRDKKFDDLTSDEKDELLKALAISLGIVKE